MLEEVRLEKVRLKEARLEEVQLGEVQRRTAKWVREIEEISRRAINE